jgi:hypothetical protein
MPTVPQGDNPRSVTSGDILVTLRESGTVVSKDRLRWVGPSGPGGKPGGEPDVDRSGQREQQSQDLCGVHGAEIACPAPCPASFLLWIER